MTPKTLADQWNRFVRLMPSHLKDPDFLGQVQIVFYSGAVALNELFSNAGKGTLIDVLTAVSVVQKELCDYMEAEIANLDKQESAKKKPLDMETVRAHDLAALLKSSLN